MVDADVGNYKIVRKIAEGEVAEVFEAIDLMHDRRAAIKCLRPEVARRPEIVQRFYSEAQTLALLDHPNIATVFSFIREGDRLYLAMEFVEGETLAAILKRSGRLEPAVALSFFDPILCAVEFAHSIGVIHRDLKPSNIMVTDSGAVKVTDFGIAHILGSAKKTSAGSMVGTLQYMSPEQIRGEPVDSRSDIYSLGILVYELIVGRVPFDSDSDLEIMRAQIEEAPPPPRVFVPDSPEWLEAFLRRALAKSPSNRFQSVTDMSRAMRLAVEANNPSGSTQPVTNSLGRSGSLALSPFNSMLATGNRLLQRFGTSLADREIGWKQYALVMLLLVFVSVEAFLLAGGNTLLNRVEKRLAPATEIGTKDKPLSQPDPNPIEISSQEVRNEQQEVPEVSNEQPEVEPVKPINNSPKMAAKQPNNRSASRNQPEPAQKNQPEPARLASVDLPSKFPSAGTSPERQTERDVLKEPSPRETIPPEKKVEKNMVKIKLNVQWEN